LLAGARARGYRIAEVPVTHLPRLAGEATGANLAVIARAFRDLARFRRRLRRELREEKRNLSVQKEAQRQPGEKKRSVNLVTDEPAL
jgi:hypothetical protein